MAVLRDKRVTKRSIPTRLIDIVTEKIPDTVLADRESDNDTRSSLGPSLPLLSGQTIIPTRLVLSHTPVVPGILTPITTPLLRTVDISCSCNKLPPRVCESVRYETRKTAEDIKGLIISQTGFKASQTMGRLSPRVPSPTRP